MKADEALEKSQGKPVYALHHGDLLKLYQREDGRYVQEIFDLTDSTRTSTYIHRNLDHVLRKDRRRMAEWYLSEDAARIGKRQEEFYIYTSAIYQHKETKELVYAKFCNGELVKLGKDTQYMHLSAEKMREFLLNVDQYKLITSWWLHTLHQSQRESGYAQKQAERAEKYRYVYFNLKDNQEYDQYVAHLRNAIALAHAHARGVKKKPLYIEGPDIGHIDLHPEELPNGRFRIPELEILEGKEKS